MNSKPENNEFSRPVDTGNIPLGGFRFRERASDEELAALGRRFDLAGMKRFSIEGTIAREGKAGYVLEARLEAEYGEICVVSLEPIDKTMDINFTAFAEPGETDEVGDLIVPDTVDPITGDLPFVITSGMIDLGECAVQYFADQLEPYPRKPGASLSRQAIGGLGRDEEIRDNPFKVLQKPKDVP